jgi:cytochrome c2
MTNYKRTVQRLTLSIIIFLSGIFTNNLFAQDGKTLFSNNCAQCHAVNKQLTGPALAGVQERWHNNIKNLHAWIHNNAAFRATGDAYANNLYNQFGHVNMSLFPNLSDADIDAILAYIKSVPATPPVDNNNPAPGVATGNDNTLLFGILTLILAIVALTLLQINSSLKKLADDKAGEPSIEPVPFWRNKTYIGLVIVVLFLVGGYLTAQGAIGLGRSQDYEPVQPIFYSHKVHAGVNQINCMYCHIGTYQGKQATIPSVNICMNCHMAINEYKGPKIYNGEGEEVDGTREIQKLYKYAGFTFGQPWDASKAKPIAWVRIHNLPDHVYFNHSQHVVAGKVQCQTCHGEIQKMDEVKQFAPLSMGWCVNCHRSTKVNFKDNGFYSIYEKYHEDIRTGKRDSVTVEDIGGTECQKCHY